MVRGIDEPLRVVTVCGVGMGSSLILKMTAQRALASLGVKAHVEHTDLPGLRGMTADVIIAQPLHATEVRGLAPIVVEVTNFLDEEALRSVLAVRLREAGWLPGSADGEPAGG